MSSLSKTISLVAAAAAVTGPSTAAAQRRGGGRGNFLPTLPNDRDRGGDCNATEPAPQVASIVNGASTGGPRSYMGGLTVRGLFEGIVPNCGGTLISPNVMLTAAHCMYVGVNWDPLNQVLVNLYDRNDPAGVVTINIQDPSEGADIVVHPDFNPSGFPIFSDNDIALMFLPVGQVADYVQINDDPHEPVVPAPLRVMGWGRTACGGSASDVLLETTVEYISNEECQEAYADISKANPNLVITDGMMCGYQNFTGSCQGDSGGPIFHVDKDGEIGDRPIEVGIVSFAVGCATPEYPGVYTRVSYFAEWVKDTVCSRSDYATKELCGSSKSGKRA